MALPPRPPINPNQPIPNNPFYYPESNALQGEYSPFIIGSGLNVDNATGIISASSVAASLAAGAGISLTTAGGITTIANTGLISITGNLPISIAGGVNPVISVDAATTVTPGVVQLNNSVTSTSTTEAATANAVKTAYDAAIASVQSIVGTTPVQVDNTDPQNPVVSVDAASTTAAGIVQLNNTLNSTSITQALTAAQGKVLQDEINALSIASNLTFAGTLDTVTGNLVTVTSAAAAQGFVIGSPLPAAAAGNADFFVIVTVPSPSYTPPGGAATETHIGDWFLSDGSAWEFLDVGFDPPYASTTTPGVVELSDDAETQAGTDATLAVTPASLQSKVSDSVATTSSTTIASSTAVKTAYDLADAAIPDSAFTVIGDILAGTGAGTYSALPVGADGQFLSANSGCATGLEWITPVSSATPTVAGVVFGLMSCDFCGTVGLGYGALQCLPSDFTAGRYNTAVGYEALKCINTASGNTAIGYCAGARLGPTTTSSSVFVGCCAGYQFTGQRGIFIGPDAGYSGGTGNFSIGIGNCALRNGSSGLNNIAIGTETLLSNGSGTFCDNTALGACAARCLVTGSSNFFLGTCSGSNLTDGSGNIFLGANVQASSATVSDTLEIGCGTSRWLSGDSTYAIKPGAGVIDCAGSCGTAGQVLMSDGANAICWGDQVAYPPATPLVEGLVYGCTTSASSNVMLGRCALCQATGINNVAVGQLAGCGITTGQWNVVVGALACMSSKFTESVAIGAFGGLNLGCQTIAIGAAPGGQACDANQSVFIGGRFTGPSGATTFPVNSSIHIGVNVGQWSAGSCNVGIGRCSLGAGGTLPIVNNNNNVAIGANSMQRVTTGSNNVALGFSSGTNICAGSSNVLLGAFAGNALCGGGCNVFIGPGVGGTLPFITDSCTLRIGFSNACTWICGLDTKAIKPGGGIIDCADSCGTAGQVLMSNGANAICWGDASGGVQGVTGTSPITVDNTDPLNPVISADAASTTAAGVVQLNDTTTSTSTTEAATANALKTTYDVAAAAIPCSIVTATGDLIVGASALNPVALPVGTDGQALIADSGSPEGLCWGSVAVPDATPLVSGSVFGCVQPTTCSSPNVGIGGCVFTCLTSGGSNIALGTRAGGKITTGFNNTAIGVSAMNGFGAAVVTGQLNIAIGTQSAGSLSTGNQNIFIGYVSGARTCEGCDNIGIGTGAGTAITTGFENIAIGCQAMGCNNTTTGGSYNVAIGKEALREPGLSSCCNIVIGFCAARNVNSTSNVYIGAEAATTLGTVPTGNTNVGVGACALKAISSGSCNVAIGFLAGCTTTTSCNVIVIGQRATASSATVCNQITLGNNQITAIRAQVTTITSLSDERDKTDIVALPVGLDFINSLKPVKFTWQMREENPVKDGTSEAGFIAQDLQAAQEAAGAKDYLDLVLDDNPDKLEASPGKLIPVLVKAIQELSAEVQALKAQLNP